MDRLRHTAYDWRRAAAYARDDLARQSPNVESLPGAVAGDESAPARLSIGQGPTPDLCGLGLNGLSCTLPAGHASELHSWEVEARLPRYRLVGEGS